MKFSEICLILTFLSVFYGCNTIKKSTNNHFTRTTIKGKRIKITGIAVDVKRGSGVIADDVKFYFLEERKSWSKKHLEKRVIIRGRLYEINSVLLDSTIDVAYIQEQKILKRVIYRKAIKQNKSDE